MRNLHAIVSTVLQAWIAAGSVERACTSLCLCLECILGCMYVHRRRRRGAFQNNSAFTWMDRSGVKDIKGHITQPSDCLMADGKPPS